MQKKIKKFSIKKIVSVLFVFLFSFGMWFFITSEKNNKIHKENITKVIQKKRTIEKGGKTEINTTYISEELKNSSKEKALYEQGSIDIYFKAKKNSDALLCVEIEDEDLKMKCLDTIAFKESLRERSLQGCDTLINEKTKIYCKDMVLLEKAKEEDFFLCEDIKSIPLQKKCFSEKEKFIIRSAKTKEDCKKISLQEEKTKCLRRFLTVKDFRFSPSKCKVLPEGKDKVLCFKMTISSLLLQQKDVDCTYFSGEVLKYCLAKKEEMNDENFYNKALETANYRYCNKIKNSDQKVECRDNVLFNSAFSEKNISLCELIENKGLLEKCKDEQGKKLNTYFYRKAKLEQNRMFCLKIFDLGLQKKCIQFFE